MDGKHQENSNRTITKRTEQRRSLFVIRDQIPDRQGTIQLITPAAARKEIR